MTPNGSEADMVGMAVLYRHGKLDWQYLPPYLHPNALLRLVAFSTRALLPAVVLIHVSTGIRLSCVLMRVFSRSVFVTARFRSYLLPPGAVGGL